jgi:hypothetical protein
MRIGQDRAKELLTGLRQFEKEVAALPGIHDLNHADVLVLQMVSSIRRIEYIRILNGREIDARRCDPKDDLFDPILGALHLSRAGQPEEAVWLTFFGTNFGKHGQDGWKLARNIYGSFGAGPDWTLVTYQANKPIFEQMLVNHAALLADPSLSGRYSNHRQYVSKRADVIAKAVESFFDLIQMHGGFHGLLVDVNKQRGQEPGETFDGLFTRLDAVSGFGRLAKFDFLTMIGKLQLAPISPNSTYLNGATGPLRGARLLFEGSTESLATARNMGSLADRLDDYLHVGKQVIEDSLCNWQKSPDVYEYFSG